VVASLRAASKDGWWSSPPLSVRSKSAKISWVGLNMVKDDSLQFSLFLVKLCFQWLRFESAFCNSYWPSRLRINITCSCSCHYRTSRNCSRVRGMEERLTGRADQLQFEIEELTSWPSMPWTWCWQLRAYESRSSFINKISALHSQPFNFCTLIFTSFCWSPIWLSNPLATECLKFKNSVGPVCFHARDYD